MKKVLVVVDCQNDFIDGSLGTPEAQAIIPNIVNKIEEYKNNGNDIYVTLDTHEEDYLNTQEGERLPVLHCIKDTWGWKLNEDVRAILAGYINTHYVEKNRFGCASLSYEIETDNTLSGNPDKLEVEYIGLCTDICVISNVLLHKAIGVDSTVVKVDSSCCAGTTLEKHYAALEVMKSCQVEVF